MNKGQICVILQRFSDSQNGQVNLDSRITQEKIADMIIEGEKAQRLEDDAEVLSDAMNCTRR